MNSNTENLNEGIFQRGADIAYAFRFLKLLVTPWNKMEAFKQGIIDRDGEKLKNK